ncbi:hypothetical protein A0H76_189 [Hepatospora eriocheir]|uniref:Uncharacterized protein n=1 Tax=Hepatospora eriocheir TaxID=1081669 RepID=A0A1X0QJ26_9MICR|nr:hypothetical protein A0H76_189 [Hepatospora eriocheir]
MLKLKDLVNKSFDINMFISKVNCCLRQFHYTLKQVSFVLEQSCDQTIDQRLGYTSRFNELKEFYKDKNLVFLDKVSFAISTKAKKDVRS